MNSRSILDDEATTGGDLIDFIKHYRNVLDQLDEKLGEDFPLWDVIEKFDREQTFTEELSNHKQGQPGAAPKSAGARRRRPPRPLKAAPQVSRSRRHPALPNSSDPSANLQHPRWSCPLWSFGWERLQCGRLGLRHRQNLGRFRGGCRVGRQGNVVAGYLAIGSAHDGRVQQRKIVRVDVTVAVHVGRLGKPCPNRLRRIAAAGHHGHIAAATALAFLLIPVDLVGYVDITVAIGVTLEAGGALVHSVMSRPDISIDEVHAAIAIEVGAEVAVAGIAEVRGPEGVIFSVHVTIAAAIPLVKRRRRSAVNLVVSPDVIVGRVDEAVAVVVALMERQRVSRQRWG